jgi:DNA-binding GntR family transcriptional regulator
MLRICDQLYDLNIRYRYIAGQSQDYRGRKVDDEHQVILDAVIAEDTDKAVSRLLSHYEKTGDFLKAYIE